MIGSNVSTWLERIKSENPEEKNKSANHLFALSEWYFDDKKVATEERLEIVKDLIELQNDPNPIVRKCVVYLTGLLKMPSKSVNNLLAKMLIDENEEI
jgi:HEAT repeat protein